MSINITDNGQTVSLTITGELTIYTALEYRNSILEGFSSKRNLDIDLDAVEEIDSSGLQLLAAMHKELVQNGFEMNIKAASEAASEALETSCLINADNCNKQEKVK